MSINNLNTLVIIENEHPLFDVIKTHFETRTVEEALNSFKTYDLVIDLSALRTKNKILVLKEMAKTTKADIITDLTLSWGQMVYKSCPNVIGSLSLLFLSPTTSVEYSVKNEKSRPLIEDFLKTINRSGIEHKNLQLGFHYPRIISMIINEAYFALDENLASEESIDLAMKNGVNYPIGPIEWGNKIGLKYIVDLLSEYAQITDDPRYRISKKLKLLGSSL